MVWKQVVLLTLRYALQPRVYESEGEETETLIEAVAWSVQGYHPLQQQDSLQTRKTAIQRHRDEVGERHQHLRYQRGRDQQEFRTPVTHHQPRTRREAEVRMVFEGTQAAG